MHEKKEVLCHIRDLSIMSCMGVPGGRTGRGRLPSPHYPPPTWSDCVPEDGALGDCHGRLTATAAGAAMM